MRVRLRNNDILISSGSERCEMTITFEPRETPPPRHGQETHSFLFGPNSTQQLDDYMSRRHNNASPGSPPTTTLLIQFRRVRAGFFDGIDQEHWTTFCDGIHSALPAITALNFGVSIDSGHSGEKVDWFLSTLFSHMPTQTITEVSMSFWGGGVGSVRIPKTWDALHPLVHVQEMTLMIQPTVQVETNESLANVFTMSWPRLTKLVFLADIKFGLRWDPVIEAVRTKRTLRNVDVLRYEETDALSTMCTFPFIHSIIQRYHLALTEGEPGNPSTAQLQPPTAENPASLENWLNAMEHCLHERHRFDCFHYFFSQIDPLLYISGEY
ncbi:expressed unknown protein [Seminavis robusta]|uniref:Uncharacterized protein n=1 Tax=Seminavis robusta TaxID=568900 RepID=A0A9N8EHZ9_9STRA|nr:expressed unknown protein [Seminavis robusta]|eukprot:Sro966_g225701.1  (325) ;mRNA; f:18503-19477